MPKGIFVTFDGQHGVGKSFVIRHVREKLIIQGYSVLTEKEPTDTEIGLLARKSEQGYSGKTLACLFAADRYQHCKLLVEKLACYDVVLCDRYIISALILQNMDGVDFDDIMGINDEILKPDMQIVLYADDSLINERLKERELTRLAKQERSEHYDRYQYYKNEIEEYVGDIIYMPNNSENDVEEIYNTVLQLLVELGRRF